MINVTQPGAGAPENSQAGPVQSATSGADAHATYGVTDPVILRFTAQASDFIRETLRKKIGLPPDQILEEAWNQPEFQARRGKRARAAIERRSDRPSATPPAPTSRAEQAKLRREARDRARYREALERRAKAWDGPQIRKDDTGKQWRQIPQDAWIMVKDVLTGGSAAWRYWAAKFRNKTALGAIRRAALVPIGEGSATKRTWGDQTARRIAALGLLLLKLAKHTRRLGQWEHEVRGINVGALRWALADPIGPWVDGDDLEVRARKSRRPSRSALSGSHRGFASDAARGQVGYLRALERAGFMRAQQWYPHAAEWERGRYVEMRHGNVRAQLNRYRVVGDVATRDARQRPELVELNRDGWRSLSEQPIPVGAEKKATRDRQTPPAPS